MYDKLDALIFENIKSAGEARLYKATGGKALEEARRLAELTGREDFRVLDGRLQALRRRGLIRHVGGTWRLTWPSEVIAK
jgi:hypothetical protein